MAIRKTILDLRKMKKEGKKITMLSAYDYTTAQFAEQAGMDTLLVGDSLGNNVYGYPFGTLPVTVDQSIAHTAAVRRGAPNTFLIGDLPFGSYQTSPEDGVRNAIRFYKEAGVDAIKPEGGRRVAKVISALADSGMVVMAHIGLTPQSSAEFGGYKAQGRTAESAYEIILDARSVREAGAQLLILEAVTPEVGKIITEEMDIPVFGIGAGPFCDGQLLLSYDLLGIWEAFHPKFVKRYANLGEESLKALQNYVKDVQEKKFPSEEHCYRMIEGENEKLAKLIERK